MIIDIDNDTFRDAQREWEKLSTIRLPGPWQPGDPVMSVSDFSRTNLRHHHPRSQVYLTETCRKLALYLEQYELINQELAAQVIDLQTKIKAT